jgi:prevent-host-death family protein
MRVMQINIYEAKTKLPALLDRVAAGEDVVIARAGTPVARLVALHAGATASGVRLGGLKRARVRIDPECHAPLADDELLGT